MRTVQGMSYRKRNNYSRKLKAMREARLRQIEEGVAPDYPLLLPELRRRVIVEDYDFGTVRHEIGLYRTNRKVALNVGLAHRAKRRHDMRNMSFALTTDQIRDGSKTVTRRLGWRNLKAGDLLRPVKKCMGLKPGETIEPLRDPVRVVSVRREPLRWLTDSVFGDDECKREGFPEMTPGEFVVMFCATHKGCTPETEITRIEFEYVG